MGTLFQGRRDQQLSDIAKNYIYVDAHFENVATGGRTRWVRMKTSDLRKLIVNPSGNTNCYATVQRYRDATSLREFERHQAAVAAAPSPASRAIVARTPPTPPPTEEDFADGQLHYHGVYFDIDCNPDKQEGTEEERLLSAITRSLEDTRKIVSFFQKTMKVPDPLVQIWYSGRKGFHLMVHPEVFGIQPHRYLTTMVKFACLQLQDRLELAQLDPVVYTRKGRQWRLPNSIHPKSNLFKVEFTVREILDLTAQQIITRAKVIRNDVGTEDVLPLSHIWPAAHYADVQPIEDCQTWWAQFVDLFDVRLEMNRLRPQKPIHVPINGGDDFPACMKDLINNGMKPTGPNRNRVLLPMVGFMVDAGVEKIEARKMLHDWTRTHAGEPAHELNDRLTNADSVINAGYAGGLHFSCRAIRSNSGKTAEEKVKCDGAENCKWIKNPSDQDPAEVPSVHLSEANKGCYIGTKVRVPVHIAALAPAKYGIPLRGKIECQQAMGEMCDECVNGKNGANKRLEFIFSAEDARVLELAGVNKNEKISAVRAHCKIPPKCTKNGIVYAEQTNLEEVQLIPMVDYAQIYMEDPHEGSSSEKDDLVRQSKHVVQRAFHMGHGIQPNKKYMIEASVFNHPKDQKVVLLFDKAEPAQNDVDQFVMTPDRYESMRAFQRRPGQSVKDKLLEIHQDFTANVHQIGGRFDLSIAIDLCYHSIIGFQFDGRMNFHGWWELLVIGDSGTGKSTIVNRFIQHFGLGEMIAGEEARRTGLVYASIQMGGEWIIKWGKIPQNDRRLLVVDEFSGIPQEEVEKLTQLRTEGRAKGGGVAQDHEIFARTRLIFLTNPRGGNGSLGEYNTGIDAILGIFKSLADLRRVDLAVVAEKGEVSADTINQRWNNSSIKHIYTSDLCRSVVLWAWSREPRHVEWRDGAEERVTYWARELGEVYDCDVTLAYKGDLRIKIARIAVSVAARLFSTDAEAKKVYVDIDHVDFAAKFMDQCYRKPTMAFFDYAKRYKETNTFTDERREVIRKMLCSFDDHQTLIRLLANESYITKSSLSDTLSLPKDDLDKLWKFLNSKGLIQKNYKAYKKSPAFTEYLKELGQLTGGYRGALGDDFASGVMDPTDPEKQKEVDEFYAGPIPTYEDTGGDDPPF